MLHTHTHCIERRARCVCEGIGVDVVQCKIDRFQFVRQHDCSPATIYLVSGMRKAANTVLVHVRPVALEC